MKLTKRRLACKCLYLSFFPKWKETLCFVVTTQTPMTHQRQVLFTFVFQGYYGLEAATITLCRFLLFSCFVFSSRTFLDGLINPLQEQMEEWKKGVNTLDKDHAKGKTCKQKSCMSLCLSLLFKLCFFCPD